MEPAAVSAPVMVRDGGRFGALVAATYAVGCLLLPLLALMGAIRSAPPAWVAGLVLLLPWLVVLAWVAGFLLWIVLPDRRLPPLASGLLLLGAAGLWGPGWAARPEVIRGEPLRLLSWNVRRLWGGPDDGGDPLGCVVQTVSQAQPQALTLLEVGRSDIRALAQALRLDCRWSAYVGGEAGAGGGQAVCVSLDGSWRLSSGGGRRFLAEDDWFYVSTEVERNTDQRKINLLSVHLAPYRLGQLGGSWPELLSAQAVAGRVADRARQQANQAQALLERAQRLRDPTLVAGDFNSTRDMALHYALRGSLTDAWERGGHGWGGTFDLFGWLPLRIDFVYAGNGLNVGASRVLPVGCSDHRPVLVQVGFPD